MHRTVPVDYCLRCSVRRAFVEREGRWHCEVCGLTADGAATLAAPTSEAAAPSPADETRRVGGAGAGSLSDRVTTVVGGAALLTVLGVVLVVVLDWAAATLAEQYRLAAAPASVDR